MIEGWRRGVISGRGWGGGFGVGEVAGREGVRWRGR